MKAWHIVLLIIIGVGFFLSTYHLLDRGLTCHDEGYYLVGTQQLKERPLFSLPSCSAKPGHISLISLMSIFVGLEDYTSLIISAIFGILTIFLIYLVGRGMYSRESGLWAAFLIAISPYHLYYSRSGYSFTSALFFYILGIYLYYLSQVARSRKLLKLLISGICIGLAIACHHSFFWLWLVLPIYELFLSRFAKRRIVILIFSLFLPAIIFEGLVRITNFLNPGTGNDGFAYLPQLRRIFAHFIPLVARFDSGRSSNFSFFNINLSVIPSYLRFLWRLEGPVVCLLFVLGIIIILNRLSRKFSLNDFIILTQTIIPLFIWFGHACLCNRIRVKALFVILPGMAFIVSQAIIMFKDLIREKGRSGFAFQLISTILIVSLITCPVAKGLREIIGIRSSIKEAKSEVIEYLKATSISVAINPSAFPIWQFYFRKNNIRDFYPYKDGVSLREGLFIIDYGTRGYLNQEIVWRSHKITVRNFLTILEDTTPIINIPYLRDDFLERSLKPGFEYNKAKTLEYLRVYDLRKMSR